MFLGCFQRADNDEQVALKIFNFLHHAENEDQWKEYLTLMTATNLASTLTKMNDLFLQSKVTLRSRICSLYESSTSTNTHVRKAVVILLMTIPVLTHTDDCGKTFDYYTATLGTPTELVIPRVIGAGSDSLDTLHNNMLHYTRCKYNLWNGISSTSRY